MAIVELYSIDRPSWSLCRRTCKACKACKVSKCFLLTGLAVLYSREKAFNFGAKKRGIAVTKGVILISLLKSTTLLAPHSTTTSTSDAARPPSHTVDTRDYFSQAAGSIIITCPKSRLWFQTAHLCWSRGNNPHLGTDLSNFVMSLLRSEALDTSWQLKTWPWWPFPLTFFLTFYQHFQGWLNQTHPVQYSGAVTFAMFPTWENHAFFLHLFFRLKLKFSCMMELSKFPLDEQVCTMEIASCKYEQKSITHKPLFTFFF